MNCRNCGGAMELFASRGYFYCRYCGSFHFPESAPDQGVRVLAESKEPLPCPVCRTTLSTAVLDQAHEVHYCQACRGVLLARGSFAQVIQHRRAWATNPPVPPVPLRKEELDRKVQCPKCAATLLAHPYYGPGNVVVDSCTTCDLIWLDFGELKQIVDAPGRDRGLREKGTPVTPLPDPTTTRAIGHGHSRTTATDVAAEGIAVFLELFS